MKTDQKLGLTEGLLALVCALLIWQTQLLLSVSKEVVALQVQRIEHERRISNLEATRESSAAYPSTLRDNRTDSSSAGT